jgi:hypothetical protein
VERGLWKGRSERLFSIYFFGKNGCSAETAGTMAVCAISSDGGPATVNKLFSKDLRYLLLVVLEMVLN